MLILNGSSPDKLDQVKKCPLFKGKWSDKMDDMASDKAIYAYISSTRHHIITVPRNYSLGTSLLSYQQFRPKQPSPLRLCSKTEATVSIMDDTLPAAPVAGHR